MYLYNTWEETGDESVECRALRKFLRQIELHKTGQVYFSHMFHYVIFHTHVKYECEMHVKKSEKYVKHM